MDKPCWETNSKLWSEFSDVYKEVNGIRPSLPVTEEEVKDLIKVYYAKLGRDNEVLSNSCEKKNPELWKLFCRVLAKKGLDAYDRPYMTEEDVKEWLGEEGFTKFLPRKGAGWVFVPAEG